MGDIDRNKLRFGYSGMRFRIRVSIQGLGTRISGYPLRSLIVSKCSGSTAASVWGRLTAGLLAADVLAALLWLVERWLVDTCHLVKWLHCVDLLGAHY